MERVVGLDIHLKKTQGTIMQVDGSIEKQERFDTNEENIRGFLKGLPSGTKVAIECSGLCWPYIELIEKLGHKAMLADPAKVRARAEDVKSDRIDSELLANLARVNWLPEVYVPNKELRWLRSLLRHRAFRRRVETAFKNRVWSEIRKRGIEVEANLSTIKGRKILASFGIFEVNQNLGLVEALENQLKVIELKLYEKYGRLKIVNLLQKIPGIGLLTALTIYAEVCDISRFQTPDKLARYAGLVPRVKQSGEVIRLGRETKGNKWLKWILIEAAWSHIRFCRDGRLAKLFEKACKRKRDKRKAIKIVARKLVNIIWAIWRYEREFNAYM